MPTVGVNAFATASKYVDKVVVVKYVPLKHIYSVFFSPTDKETKSLFIDFML